MTMRMMRLLCCLLSVVLLSLGVSFTSVAETDDYKTAFALDNGIIIDVEKRNGTVYVKTYLNGILVESATGNSTQIDLQVYDGCVEVPIKRETLPTGHVLETRHLPKSSERFQGQIDQEAIYSSRDVDDEPAD